MDNPGEVMKSSSKKITRANISILDQIEKGSEGNKLEQLFRYLVIKAE